MMYHVPVYDVSIALPVALIDLEGLHIGGGLEGHPHGGGDLGETVQ